jgi:hypothetical protein
VPAYQWLYSGHDIIHHHRRRYRLRALENLAATSGLNVVRSGYFNSILFPLVAMVRLAARITRRPAHSDMKMPGKWMNALLAGVFGLESIVLRYVAFPFGTSIFLVASSKRAANAPATNVAG